MKIATILFGAALALLAWQAPAQEVRYPENPVVIVVPQAAGGANDIIARVVAAQLSRQTGQQFVVENRPGAGGNLGTAMAARSQRDGYTLLLTVSSAHVINPALYKKPGFDPVRDFVPVASLATAGYVLVAHPSFPANSVQQLIQRASAQREGLRYASAGNGTLNHLIMEMMAQRAGIKFVHVPYKGAAPAVQDVVGGQVPLSVQSLPSSLQFIKTGRLKVLAVANEKRVAMLPDVPTVGETIPGFGATPWYGLFAPTGTPAPIVTRLRQEVAKALSSAELREQLALNGCEVFATSPEQFASLIATELPHWAAIVKFSGAHVD